MDYPGKVITKTQVTPTQTSASGNWTLDDQAAAIKNNNWPVALVPNPISKSLRFNSADSAYLNRTPASAGNRKTWTFSCWFKKAANGVYHELLSASPSGGGVDQFFFSNNDTLSYYFSDGTVRFNLATTQVFRDPSAWYHIILAVDTTQATSTDRAKIYVNGTQITALSATTYAPQNQDTYINNSNLTAIGSQVSTGAITGLYPNGYMTEVNFIDGQALTPSDFGLTNPQTGQWIPKKYTGTYGTNGFYLNFKDATSTTTLGYDYSGNANNWTTNNFSVTAGVGNDSLTDVPTPWVAYSTTGDSGGVVRGNYATLNPLSGNQYGGGPIPTLTNGNLNAAFPGGIVSSNGTSTIALLSGKWYCEFTVNSLSSPNLMWFGCQDVNGFTGNGSAYNSSGVVICNGVTQGTYSTFTNGDVIGCAFDITNNQASFYKNGTQQGTTGTLGVTTKTYAVWLQMGNSGDSCTANFGQRPFAYTPPAGFRSLCTTNLPATTIGFGLTNQGDDYFNTVLYTGNGSTNNITGVGFQPDFVWLKDRTTAFNNYLYDAVRGTTKALQSNSTNAEETRTGLTAFGSDGFTLGSQGGDNQSSDSFVAWNWKASGSTVSNTAGTITSTVSANTTAGFAIATTTGAGGTGTIGHGLGAVPQFIMCFRRNTAADHYCYHQAIGNTNYLVLNTTAASAASANMWNNTTPTSTVFSVGNTNNNSGDTYVHYIFAPVPGYSAFGSYTGNGSADGPFVYTGFRPRYLMVKEASGTSAASGNWVIYDAARDTYNVCGLRLVADNSYAEGTVNAFDFLSNGFKLRTTDAGRNESGGTYIYAAFAEAPFQFANAR